jgi:hypothetical protein
MKYILYIKISGDYPDFEDECEAHSFNEALSIFRKRNPRALREIDDETLAQNVYKEPKAKETDMF